jgi:hypothetical protein
MNRMVMAEPAGFRWVCFDDAEMHSIPVEDPVVIFLPVLRFFRVLSSSPLQV